MPKYNFVVPDNLSGFRLDKAVAIALKRLAIKASRVYVQKSIKEYKLSVNGTIISNLSFCVKENDDIEIFLDEEKQNQILSTNIPLDIVYEDDDLMVINKSSSMSSHPGAGNYSDTLVNALMYHTNQLSDIGGDLRPGIVHRLDKNTSGLMVVAKNNKTHESLVLQIKSRILKRKYKALIWGMVRPQDGIINQQIARSTIDRKKMTTIKSGGKISVTHYKTLEIFKGGMFSLLQCQLESGRTHQIRVHLSHVGHSIVGDQLYGNNKRKIESCKEQSIRKRLEKFNHQALHSFYISFTHPTNLNVMEFEKELPLDYYELLEFLRQ